MDPIEDYGEDADCSGEEVECCERDECPGTCDYCGFSMCEFAFDVYQCDCKPTWRTYDPAYE